MQSNGTPHYSEAAVSFTTQQLAPANPHSTIRSSQLVSSREDEDRKGAIEPTLWLILLVESRDNRKSVRNVTTIVPLRAYTSKAGILPEQTLGRGLRRMTPPGQANEIVAVVEHGEVRFGVHVRNAR